MRNPRQRVPRGASRVGERFDVEVGPIAHGGHCVVRLPEPESRVVFVRHALPGERVVVAITEGTEGDRFWRGDAVEILEASPDRTPAPCPVAGPGLCGGCDFQHVGVPRQRLLKADVVREQLVRLGRLDPRDPLVADLAVERVPGDRDGLRWRTRVEYATTPDGRRGLRKHRSHDVVPVDDRLIAHPDAISLVGKASVEPASVVEPSSVVEPVETTHGRHEFAVASNGFWQVHPGAPRVLVETVLDFLDPKPGETVLDLFSGVGLFARFLTDAVGPEATVVAIEADWTACAHARENLGSQVVVERGTVDRVLERGRDGLDHGDGFDLVVLDPPREGAKRQVVEQIADRVPRAVASVACDPAALARDVANFAEHGYRLRQIRAFDLFPMTHHVECVALLEPQPVAGGR